MIEKEVFSPGCLGKMLLLFIVAGWSPLLPFPIQAEELEIQGAKDSRWAIIKVPFSHKPKQKVVTLQETRTDRLCYAQAYFEGDKPFLVWIEPHLRAGEKKRYRILTGRGREKGESWVEVIPQQGRVEIRWGGKLFTRYEYTHTPRPYFYPLIGPTGKPLTRSYPIEHRKGESTDHPHHRSFWFAFGNVNGEDFWTDGAKAGRIVHQRILAWESGPVFGMLKTQSDWITAQGEKIAEDERTLLVFPLRESILLDFTLSIRPTKGPLRFGDTKEGMMALRVASSMEVTRGQGHILLASGRRDREAWGHRAKWCDYWGPVEGETVGIGFFDHPSNWRHPTYWHVRDYGLFAANPFGLRDFTQDPSQDGSFTLPLGRSLTFHYGFYLHKGSPEEAEVEKVYNGWVSFHPLNGGTQ